MKIFSRKPASFRTLLGFSFICLSFPLVLGLFDSGISIDRLVRKYNASIYRVFNLTKESNSLVNKTVALERSARQFSILKDPLILDAFKEQDANISEAAERILALVESPEHRSLLRSFIEVKQQVADKLTSPENVSSDIESALLNFEELNGMAREILAESNREAFSESDRLRIESDEALRQLTYKGLALVVVLALLIIYFFQALTKPVRRVHDAIEQLGAGAFDDEISVPGPWDIQLIGVRLDWLRKRLARFEAQKAHFLALISHELKTPLAAMREGISLLSEGLVGAVNPDQREVLGIVNHSCERLEGQINDLLLYTVAKAKGSTPARESFEFGEIVRSSVAKQRLAARSREIELTLELENVFVRGDKKQLMVVCDNLVSNALKFTPHGGSIFISLTADKGTAIFEVQDSGAGVPQGERALIFEPFYQGESADKTDEIGAGIGLSIVAENVEAHGGTIEVLEGRWGGALFRVRLPKEKGLN